MAGFGLHVDDEHNDMLDLPPGSAVCYFCFHLISQETTVYAVEGTYHERRATH